MRCTATLDRACYRKVTRTVRCPVWKHRLTVTETSKRIDSDSSRLPDLRPDDSGSARPPVGSTQTKGRNDMSIEMNRRGLLAAGAAAAALPLLTPSAASARAAGTV